MAGNALSNIYIHNWIRMDPLLIPFAKPLQVSLVETGLWQRIPDEPFFGGGVTDLGIF
jgi:hypothetical protein